MFTKMLQRRGLFADLPTLDNGELGLANDVGSERVFIGTNNTPLDNSGNGTNIELVTTLSGIQITTGIADANKFVKTDALGVIDLTFLPVHHLVYTDAEALAAAVAGAIDITTGLADAGLLIKTGANGYIDATFNTTSDAIAVDRTIPAGLTHTHFNSDIQAGITLTVDGSFITHSPQIQVGGSMAVNGSVSVL